MVYHPWIHILSDDNQHYPIFSICLSKYFMHLAIAILFSFQSSVSTLRGEVFYLARSHSSRFMEQVSDRIVGWNVKLQCFNSDSHIPFLLLSTKLPQESKFKIAMLNYSVTLKYNFFFQWNLEVFQMGAERKIQRAGNFARN